MVEFRPVHLARMRAQIAQRDELEHPEAMTGAFGYAWTALDDGEPMACAGVVEVWQGRAYAWALLSEHAGRHMLALTREIRFRLARLPFRRVEMAVDAGFDAGARWARMLGFRLETPEPMRGYLPHGHDAFLFARVTDGIRSDDDGRVGCGSGHRVDL